MQRDSRTNHLALLVQDLQTRGIDAVTGKLLRELVLDPGPTNAP